MTAIQDDKPLSGKRPRRTIRFHERVQFKTIRHVSEFSEDEIKNGWYDKDDFNRMSENVSDIAKLIADGETRLDGEELCTRGLEHIVEEELADYRAEKMINSIDAVLDEQEEQWDEGKEEPGLIAELYAEYAKPLLREAHLIGLRDAEEGYKNWDDLLEEKDYQKLRIKKGSAPSSTGVNGVGKAEKAGKVKKSKKSKEEKAESSTKTKSKKSKIKKSDAKHLVPASPRKTEKDKKKIKSRKTSFTDESSHSFVSTASSQVSLLKNQGSISSINSCSLRDTSLNSAGEDFDSISENEKNSKNNTMTLKLNGESNGTSPKKHKKTTSRRSAIDRKYGKYGSEMSPFVYSRDGTLTFRKPDAEKKKREQKEKRQSAVRGSLTKFLLDDDDEDDILAGILSGKR